MLTIDEVKIQTTSKQGKLVKQTRTLLPNRLYIVGKLFWHIGGIGKIDDDLSALKAYLKKHKVADPVIEAGLALVADHQDAIGDNEDYQALRQSDWWQWACVRMLAYRQGQFVDDFEQDQAEIIVEYRVKKAKKAKRNEP